MDKYYKLNKTVNDMPDGFAKEHAKASLGLLLHIAEAKVIATKNWKNYQREMNDWEKCIENDIKFTVKGERS